MKKIALLFLISVFFTACDSFKKTYTAEEIEKESEKANAFFEDAFNRELDRSPISQTYLGIKKDQDKWDDLSEEHNQGDLELSKQLLKELETTINYEVLDKDTKLSYDLMKASLQQSIDGFKYHLYNYPVNQMFGVHTQVPSFLINIHQITDEKDARDYLSRLEKVPFYFDQLIESLKLREAKGILAPQFVFPRVIDDSRNIATGFPITDDTSDVNSIYADFEKKVNALDLDEAQKKALIAESVPLLKDKLKPAYDKLIVFLEEQSKSSTKDDGVWKFPEGEAFYKYALKKTTTTEMTPEDVFNFGKKEVERIHEEMRLIMKKVDFEGDLNSFFDFMKVDKQFYYPNTDEGKEAYLSLATKLIDSMRTRLDELFITKPKADMIVKRVEAFREKSAGTAFYNRPAPDGSRPGIYYANLYNMKNMPKYQMEALAYHEGIPGHHMQIALAQELKDVPKFRKYGGYTAYIEGWGLYSEFTPKEMGFYSDPYSDFGRLAMELWRACRLVADVGIHVKKWTREEAIEFYKKNTPDSDRDCERMVERHIVMPSQATAYKIGMYKILTLRNQAKEKLGDKFDIKEFHDVILTNGALPLNILESLVNDYISKKI